MRQSHTHQLPHSLNPDEVIQSSPPPDDAISYYTQCSRLSVDVPHGDIVLMFDDPLFNDDPPLNEPFEDVPFAQSPACNKSPLQGEISIHHPLINGA